MISLYQWPLNSKTCNYIIDFKYSNVYLKIEIWTICLGVAETVAGLVSFERWCGVSNGHQIHLQHQETA